MARKPPLESSGNGAGGITRASAVYEQLRWDITHGILEPGSKLRVEAISQRYKVGASPLREALSRMSAEGLVDRTDQRGFSVSALKWDELPTLAQTRARLESLALRDSIQARDSDWEHALVLLVHQLSRTPRSLADTQYVPNPAWESLHRDFHRTLLARCPSRWLLSFCANLADEAYRFRQVAAGQSFSSRNVHAEHMAIFEAAIGGKADEAVQMLVQHYTRTATLVAKEAREGGHTD
ncbi:MAG: GntR family transcriptional regulator [Betaproteobacteria bacterium]|nr:GntR family transcriptional regulator [Betaproteobacteria bacterium]